LMPMGTSVRLHRFRTCGVVDDAEPKSRWRSSPGGDGRGGSGTTTVGRAVRPTSRITMPRTKLDTSRRPGSGGKLWSKSGPCIWSLI